MDLLGKFIDRLWPDKVKQAQERSQAEFIMKQLELSGELEELKTRYSAIVAEANSADKWTSRARPSFMYVFYFMLISLVVCGPLVGVFFPDQMALFFNNVQKGFAAIPGELWATFTAGYLGYTAVRGWEKGKGVA
jgi:hypothetical protein